MPVQVLFCGASEDVKTRMTTSLLRGLQGVRCFDDLDTALSVSEDTLLTRVHKWKTEVDEEPGRPPGLHKVPSARPDLYLLQQQWEEGHAPGQGAKFTAGFVNWLHIASSRVSMATDKLLPLSKFMAAKTLPKGYILQNQPQGSTVDLDKGGLWFLEEGLVSVRRDPQQTLTFRSKNMLLKRDRAMLQGQLRHFQLARFGPGWCIGCDDLFSGYATIGVFLAETECKVHFVSFRRIQDLKRNNPELVLELYSLLGRLVSRQLNRTKERLSHTTDALYTSNTRRTLMTRETRRALNLLARQVG